jgi:hypothetical protein
MREALWWIELDEVFVVADKQGGEARPLGQPKRAGLTTKTIVDAGVEESDVRRREGRIRIAITPEDFAPMALTVTAWRIRSAFSRGENT